MGEGEEDVGAGKIREGIVPGLLDNAPEESETESSSSIGAPGDSEGEEEEENGVVMSRRSGGLASLDSLEDSLPIKRGLSNHYSGKSKSFANISNVSLNTAKDLEKSEDPFNKRRRVLIANKWARKSFYSWQNLKSMPLLSSLNENDEDGEGKEIQLSSPPKNKDEETARTELQKSKLKHTLTFKSHSCFSLADLHEEEQDQ
ncbi:hypothetical protein SLA2020_464920 [Shorea laevis]